MQEDYTVFRIPRADNFDTVVFDEQPEVASAAPQTEEKTAEQAKAISNVTEADSDERAEQKQSAISFDTDDYLTHSRRKDDKTSYIYNELNQIAEELETCRLRNC